MAQSSNGASFWLRVAAFLIDAVIVYAAVLLATFTFERSTGIIPNQNIQTFGAPVILYLYHVIFIAALGRTPGKMLLRLRVVDGQGGKPGFGPLLLRELIGIVGIFGALADAERRGWHDRIGDTRVVRNRG